MPDLALLEGDEVADRARSGVVEPESHPAILGRRERARASLGSPREVPRRRRNLVERDIVTKPYLCDVIDPYCGPCFSTSRPLLRLQVLGLGLPRARRRRRPADRAAHSRTRPAAAPPSRRPARVPADHHRRRLRGRSPRGHPGRERLRDDQQAREAPELRGHALVVVALDLRVGAARATPSPSSIPTWNVVTPANTLGAGAGPRPQQHRPGQRLEGDGAAGPPATPASGVRAGPASGTPSPGSTPTP